MTDDALDARAAWRLVERRRVERKVVSSTVAGWGDLRKSGIRRAARDTATIEDLSELGARVVTTRREGLTVGSAMEIEISETVGLVCVRFFADHPMHQGMVVYGIEMADTDSDLRRAVRARLAQEETSLEWVWEHTTWGSLEPRSPDGGLDSQSV